ncbi:MerR family transcriptional regulator [Marivita sp. XM-24bin2]|jgi:DNA-binding transcriptional MerR regulator|uniref:MerR family transcriptional regulator n=1 Tax=unclassified Marivita TaxID=2632480 RepID=UPI000D79F0B2|nr:MerR family transcriptional regulator [Marivita sp. XM-24bin2]MCR9107868.1 MerR family transcriptional regulator [Paracoccaceae bacterium]PWL34622.1 MAG: MerR family transcriptional regulator [Marivita sp. XM-24bin2]
MSKSADAFRTISEVAEWLDTPAHVLRFWESKFTQVKPVKRAGGRRYYRPADMRLLGGIKKLLHDDGMTIKGVQKILREQGIKHVSSLCALSLGDEDEAEQAIIADVPEAEPVDTVVPFTKPEEPAADPAALEDETEASPGTDPEPEPPIETAPEEPTAAPESEPAVEHAAAFEEAPEADTRVADSVTEDASEPEPAAAEGPADADATSEPAHEANPALPSFLQHSLSERQAETEFPEDTTPEVTTPAAPPKEPTPSALTFLSRIRSLTPKQAQEIAPILDQLKAKLR